MTPIWLDEDNFTARSFDGTILNAYRFGAGEEMPLLIVNGIGANLSAWRRVVIDIKDRLVVTWDHRGLHGSGEPASERIDAGAHAEDAVAVLDRTGVDQVNVLSWSSGTPIAVELATRYPDRVRSLAIVCGPYGHPLRRLLFHLEIGSLLPFVARLGKHFAGTLEVPFRAFVSRPEIAGIVRQSGFIGATADIEALVELLRGLADCDLRALLATYDAVVSESVRDLLPEVAVPTLLVAGSKDPFTTLNLMEEMREAVPGSRLEVYEGATHYLPLEYPARLAHDLNNFLQETRLDLEA